MLFRHDLHVDNLALLLSVGHQGGAAPVVHPPSRSDRLTAALPHDVFVVAFEADEFQVVRLPIHQPLDDLATVWPAVDIVAERDYGRWPAHLRVLNDLGYGFRKQIVAPVQVGNCVCKRHHVSRSRLAAHVGRSFAGRVASARPRPS